MDLVNEEITHKAFGKGFIVDHDESFVTVNFDDDIKKFIFPDAFGQFLTLKNDEAAKDLEKLIAKKEAKEAKLAKIRKKEEKERMLERQRQEKLRNHQIHESSQIVFWLDEEEQVNVFDQWKVSTGQIQSGKNKGQPNRPARLRPNSAALLTARASDQEETERRILGIYMVHETFIGNMNEDGFVPAHSDYQTQLTEEESEKMLFWNYYINKNYPHRTTWNSGKYRYYDNEWTARILKDLIELRTDEEEKEKLQKFLEYFCESNVLDIDEIPAAEGALKQ